MLSCCSPVLLPTVPALMGVSGTSALYFNLALRRWFVARASDVLTENKRQVALAEDE